MARRSVVTRFGIIQDSHTGKNIVTQAGVFQASDWSYRPAQTRITESGAVTRTSLGLTLIDEGGAVQDEALTPPTIVATRVTAHGIVNATDTDKTTVTADGIVIDSTVTIEEPPAAAGVGSVFASQVFG